MQATHHGADAKVCEIEGCERRPVGRGWCRKHWQRWRRTGDVLTVRPTGRPRTNTLPGLKATRENLGITRKRFASLVGIPVTTLDSIEKGFGTSEENRRAVHAAVSELFRERRERLAKSGLSDPREGGRGE